MKLNLQRNQEHQGNILLIALLTFVLVITMIYSCTQIYITKLEIMNNLILDYETKINEQWTRMKS